MGWGDFIRGAPIVGDIAGGFGMKTTAEKEKIKALEKVVTDLQAYRPEMIQTRQNALDNAMQLFGPVNNALVEAYGSNAALPIAEATKSPYPDDVMANMQPAAIKAKEQSKDPRSIQALRKSGWIK
jgi:methylthioribose-1-phosphate isomerase